MKTVNQRSPKITVIASDKKRYLSFPDVTLLPDGQLLSVWRNADAHVASESYLMISYGSPDGSKWSVPEKFTDDFGHMPRISVLSDNSVCIVDDGAPPPNPSVKTSLFLSGDGGKSFSRRFLGTGDSRVIPQAPSFAPDRITELDDGTLICAAQIRLGSTGKKDSHTFCNLIYRSEDRGKTWYPGTVIACERDLKLCEPSVCKTPDNRLLAVFRVNAAPGTNEESRFMFGDSCGYRWEKLQKAPFFGHRPTAGFTEEGKLLVTYRKVQKPYGVCAWYGTLEELANNGGCELELLPFDGDNLGDMGYTGWVETEDGRFVCVTYHRSADRNIPTIYSVSFTKDDFNG